MDVLIVFSWCTIKMVLGIGYAVTQNFSLAKAVLVGTAGGMTGVFIFTYFTDLVSRWIRKIRPPKKKKKIFTKRNRFIVKIMSNHGIFGIIVLTPPFLSIPVGTIICSRFSHSRKRIFTLLLISIIIWSVILYYFGELLLSFF